MIRIIEEDFNVESIAVGRRYRTASFQVHGFDFEINSCLHERRKLYEDVFRVQKLSDASMRVVFVDCDASHVDLRVEHVALVETEDDALSVLVQADLYGANWIVVGGVWVRAYRSAQVAETVNRIINRAEIFLDGVHAELTSFRWIGRDLKLRKRSFRIVARAKNVNRLYLHLRRPSFQKQVGESDAIVPRIVNMIVAGMCK